MTRSEKVQQAQALRRDGVPVLEIAAQMGVAKTTVYDWLEDPDHSKLRARQDSYRNRCVDCGDLTDGHHGLQGGPTRCRVCAPIAARIWDRENLIKSVQEFARRYGAPPAASDWNAGRPTAEQRERFHHDGCWPPYTSVVRRFGNWNALIEAAGFEPRSSVGAGGTRRNGSPVAV